MGEPIIVAGEGYSKAKVKALTSLITAQVLAAGHKAAGHDIRLPAIKRQDRGPFNKSKEIERRRKQIEKRGK